MDSARGVRRSAHESGHRCGKYARRRSGRRLLHWAGALAVPVLIGTLVTASAPGLVRIRPGDTLWALARTYGTSVAALQRANHLHGDLIRAGEVLHIPGNHAAGGRRAQAEVRYRVKQGDTLYYLAHRYGTSPDVIARRNRISGSMIYIGQTLVIPVRRPPAGAKPSRSYVASVIRRTAQRLGVDPALALGVAYQESGFQTRVVSPAGAVGAMQVLPGTGRWLSRDIVGRDLDLRDVEDNAYAGVLQLKLLLDVADTRTAVAGYYQGLSSVHRHGLFRDTKAYVASVMALRARFS